VTRERGALRSLALLLRTAPDWLLTAWWGLFGARIGPPVEIVQAVIVEDGRVLLARRRDLRGWELPGGNVIPGEEPRSALAREVLEETGLAVDVAGLSGVYLRRGFLPHRACVYRCRARGGALRPSEETPQVAWWPAAAPPAGLLPWCRTPLADALTPPPGPPPERRERLGLAAILESARIDLAARLRGE
jgi:8-oxo-dGTP pyrophosphatase MutT (NUDIX family)